MTAEPDRRPTTTASQRAAFAADGAICLRGALEPRMIDGLRTTIEAHLADLSPLAIVASRPGDPGHFVEDFCCWHRFDAYREAARSLAPAIAELMGSATVRLHHDHLLVKEPGTTTATPWHQDQPYYDVEGRQVVSAWIPVDPVPRRSTLELVAGSHLGPWLMPRTFMDREARWFAEGELAEVPDVAADLAADPGAHRILGWELEAGDVVVFHALALHAAGGSEHRRRILSLRFLGDDAVRIERPWRTSPPLPIDAVLPMLHPVGDPAPEVARHD